MLVLLFDLHLKNYTQHFLSIKSIKLVAPQFDTNTRAPLFCELGCGSTCAEIEGFVFEDMRIPQLGFISRFKR